MTDVLDRPTTEAGDLLYGARAIAAYLGLRERQARHLIEHGHLPSFKLGAVVVARRSSLDRWLAECEQQTRRAS